MIAALKAAAAQYGRAPSFALTRAPLLPLKPDPHKKLIAELDGHGFAMPGLAQSLEAAISG
jgi:hypothetical protein